MTAAFPPMVEAQGVSKRYSLGDSGFFQRSTASSANVRSWSITRSMINPSYPRCAGFESATGVMRV